MPAAIYIETHGGTGTGGSDDHAGVDIGRTFTETPPAATPEEFLRHVREGRAEAHGDQGSAAKWAHAAMALGDPRSDDGRRARQRRGADPSCRAAIAERVMSEAASAAEPPRATSDRRTPGRCSTPSSTRSGWSCEAAP